MRRRIAVFIQMVATAVLCGVAVLGTDLAFRTSLLQYLRPSILAPADQAVVSPPVQVRWEGPQQMRVMLAAVGEAPRDLGVHESPFEIDQDFFEREGGYQVEVQALRFGKWIRAVRWFQEHGAASSPPEKDDHAGAPVELDLRHALAAARAARDKALSRTKFMRDENAALRDESARLAKQVEAAYQTQEDDAGHTADLEKRVTELSDANRTLTDANTALQLRLNSVIPCTVWGYYSFPFPQTFPITRRALSVSDPQGRIFRVLPQCEATRRVDSTAASICFCVGNSWGG